jgi:hypothetical protein
LPQVYKAWAIGAWAIGVLGRRHLSTAAFHAVRLAVPVWFGVWSTASSSSRAWSASPSVRSTRQPLSSGCQNSSPGRPLVPTLRAPSFGRSGFTANSPCTSTTFALTQQLQLERRVNMRVGSAKPQAGAVHGSGGLSKCMMGCSGPMATLGMMP